MNHVKDSEPTTPASPATAEHQRLPCRGCRASCSLYDVCQGKPWRYSQPQQGEGS